MVKSLPCLAGLDWPVLEPNISTLSRRQQTLRVTIGAVPATTGLHLLVDSTGIKILGEVEWNTKKHGTRSRRQWRKVHLAINASTLEILAMEVTGNSVGDAPVLPGLLTRIPVGERLASVSGIALRAANANMPTRKNAKPWKTNRSGADARNDIVRTTKRLGWTIWKRGSGYHRRSLVGTKMRCVKPLGERVRGAILIVRSPRYNSGLPC